MTFQRIASFIRRLLQTEVSPSNRAVTLVPLHHLDRVSGGVTAAATPVKGW